MREIFADTSGWASLVDVSQPFDALTAQVIESTRMQCAIFVATNYIVAELVALLHSSMRISRHESIRFIDSLKSAPYVEIVNINETLDAAAWQLLKARADKN
ncbi:MAG: hypothetical protein WKF84_14060 [Pyrinomonadaceae bacterium]